MSNHILTQMNKIDANRIENSMQVPGRINQSNTANAVSFAEILNEAAKPQDTLKISKHAEMRMRMRNIQISDSQKERISKALEKAEQKGVKETLVMVDGLAFVAYIKSKTVITAVGSGELKQNIFTNIDGAVFA